MPTRISLPDHLLPVQALFNAAWEEAFIDLIDEVLKQVCETQKKRVPEQAARIDAIVAKLPRQE